MEVGVTAVVAGVMVEVAEGDKVDMVEVVAGVVTREVVVEVVAGVVVTRVVAAEVVVDGVVVVTRVVEVAVGGEVVLEVEVTKEGMEVTQGLVEEGGEVALEVEGLNRATSATTTASSTEVGP